MVAIDGDTAAGSPLARYEAIRKIGEGSYAKVYLVKSKESGRRYVLKRMSLDSASRSEMKKAVKEAQLLKKIKHPNVVIFKEAWISTHKILYIVMEYADGGDLYKFVRDVYKENNQERGLHEDDAWRLFAQLLMAMARVHSEHVLHRDIKARNVFMTSRGVVKLGDFGVSRELEATGSLASTVTGTPYYMSPELLERKPYGPQSDVWALGCLLFELVRGRMAFPAKDMDELKDMIDAREVPEIPEGYSGEIARIGWKCLSIDPADRPSVADLLREEPIQKALTDIVRLTDSAELREAAESWLVQ